MASSAPDGSLEPESAAPTPARGDGHKYRDGIIIAAVGGMLATVAGGLILAVVSNSTVISSGGTPILGPTTNIPTSTVTTKVQGPTVTRTVTPRPATVTFTAEPVVGVPRRTGSVVMVHDFFQSGSLDMDSTDANWRYGTDASRAGIDLEADCCDLGLRVDDGISKLETSATDPAAPELRDQCASATGVTDRIAAPELGALYCAVSDEGRTVVLKITDDGLDSNNTGVDLVVW